MATAGVYIKLAVGGFVLLLAIVSVWRGPRTAFLGLCWLPLAGLGATWAARNQLGYSALAALAAIVVSSIVLLLLGLRLRATAMREGSPSGPLVFGLTLAAMPLLILAALWLAGR